MLKPLNQNLIQDIMAFLSQKKAKKAGLLMITACGATVMTAWHWKLMLATGMGIGTMLLVYHWQRWQKVIDWQDWHRYAKGYQGKLTLAVSSGGLMTLSTYIAASIWSDTENRWLALGTLIQGVSTSATLGLFLWYLWQKEQNPKETAFERLSKDLTAPEPIKRLISVQKMIELRNNNQLDSNELYKLQEYFTLMLSTESEITIKQTLINGLISLEKRKISVKMSKKERYPLR